MSTMPAGGVTQLALFSRSSVRRRSTVDVAAISRAARGFTGDFYRTHRYGDRLWFAIGDVAGKGLPAAVVMAMIQEELEHRLAACAITRCDPAATMQRLHAYLRPLLPRNRFATAVIGHLQDNGTLILASAGHCPPLIARADRSVEELSPTGPVIGLLRDAGWTSTTARLEQGDALLLYTDGVIEATVDGEEFGLQRLRDLAAAIAHRSADGIARAVVSAAPHHDDDTTVVVVKR